MRTATTPLQRSVPAWILYLLFFGSGATSLVYEVLWLRELILVFGSTVFATSAVLATFMGGLALGALLAGRLVDRRTLRPLGLYGVMEIGIALYAVAVPWLLDALSPFYRMLWEAGASERFVLFSLAKFAGIAVVLIVPATLMGATLPAMAREIADDPTRIGGRVGTLYATNTFGAAAGTLLAGFVLLPKLGMQLTGWSTAAVNLALGLIALALARGATHAVLPSGRDDGAAARHASGWKLRAVLVALGLSGFAAMALEVAWTRALSLVVGSSVYAFSLMLVAFLAGLASGGAVFSRLLQRSARDHAALLLSGLLVAAGVLAFATTHVLERLPGLFARVYFAWTLSPEGWLALQFGLALMLMFPATFVLGGVFPAGLQLHARDLARVGGSVGTVYASNTAGTIAGSALAGFLLLPALGLRDAVAGVSMLQIGLGLLVAVAVVPRQARLRTAAATVAVVTLAVVILLRPEWDPRIMNSGAYYVLPDRSDYTAWEDYVADLEDDVVVYAAEGLTASVLVSDQPEIDNRFLAVNGKPEASSREDLETQLMLAHLPLLLHPSPRDVMVIGLASGITAGSAASHPIEQLRIVEVERAIEPAARLFSEFNGAVLDDPRTKLSINDARNELDFSSQSYDVIISEPSNPWVTVASNLFTEDFFRLARKRVRPGGIFCQWMQTYCLPQEDLRSLIAAFRSAFPSVLVFQTIGGSDVILLGSEVPLRLDLARIGAGMSELRVAMDLARVGIHRATDLLPLFVLGDRELDALLAGAPRNTDDNARVEFSAPKAFFIYTVVGNVEMLERHRAEVLDYLEPAPAAEELRLIRLRVAEAWLRRGERSEAERWARLAAEEAKDVQAATQLLQQLEMR